MLTCNLLLFGTTRHDVKHWMAPFGSWTEGLWRTDTQPIAPCWPGCVLQTEWLELLYKDGNNASRRRTPNAAGSCHHAAQPAASSLMALLPLLPLRSWRPAEQPQAPNEPAAVGRRMMALNRLAWVILSLERLLGHLSQHLAAPLNLLLAGTGRLGGTNTKRVSMTHTAGGAPHIAHYLLASAHRLLHIQLTLPLLAAAHQACSRT